MKKVLTGILIVVLLLGAAAGGWFWYRNTHVFVEDAAYAKNSQLLDLRGQEISLDHYISLQSQLPDCEVLWDVPFQGSKYPNDTAALTVTTLTEEDLGMLEYFPRLQKVDATGCREYLLLESLRDLRPECEIIYQVDLGGKAYDPDEKTLTLVPGDFDYDTLMANLPHMRVMESITFENTDMTPEAFGEIAGAYPEIAMDYTVELLGQTLAPDAAELDLSAMTSEDVETVIGKLPLLPGVTAVELTDAEGGSTLTLEDVKALQEAAPGVVFHYTFDFYGVKISTTDEEVKIVNKRITDEGEAEVRLAIEVMENCRRFVLDNCKLSNEVLARMREDYRDRTKVVWRIYFGQGTSLTDAEIIRTTYNLEDDNCHDLIYCEDVRYMDIGHNDYLDGVPFVAGMPNLEIIIVSGAPIKDLTPFQNCKKLRILEIAFCHYITDISPLAECESLEMLNIGFTQVTDLSALDERDMKLLCIDRAKVSAEERERFMQLQPDCWTTYDDGQPYGQGWRYDTEDKPLDWYANIRSVFRYDQDPNIPNNVGWYLDQ